MDNFQPDEVIHSVQSLMKNDTVWIILWVTTHNVILYVTTTLPTVVLR